MTILFYLAHFLFQGHKFANNGVTFDTRKIMINDFTNCVNEWRFLEMNGTYKFPSSAL